MATAGSTVQGKPGEDVWIYSACDGCNSNCGVRVHRVNGVVVKIE